MYIRVFAFFFVLGCSLAAVGQTDGERVRLTNLPHVYVETFTGSAITSKNTYLYARMWYVDEQDDVQFFDSLEIRVRGNATAGLAKKPYKLKFHDKVKLLGKGHANTRKWTLLANHGDKTLLRNAVTSLMGERAGLKFNPAAKFVDLTLNGKYVGNYQISDHVDVRPHRVNVAEQDFPLNGESDITGGYLLEADGSNDFRTEWDVWGNDVSPTGFYTWAKNVPVRIHYPDADEIDRRQYDYIQQHVQDFETRLFNDGTFADADAGYRALVDSVSLADWYICTEVSGNVDGFYSTYFYKQQDDPRLFWGPLWDYDIAYNNDNRTRNDTDNTEQQLMVNAGYGNARQWLARMWKDPWFARLVNRRFRELIDDGLERYLNDKIDSLTELIDESQQLNYQRWRINVRALRERVLYSTYDSYVRDLRNYIHVHTAYLATAFAKRLPEPQPDPEPDPEPEPMQPHDFDVDATHYYTFANAGTQTVFDVDVASNVVCCRARNEASESQQWAIAKLASGFLFITNRATGMALSDASPDGATATTQTGTTLTLATPDSTDIRQHWDLVPQDNGRYNIVSRSSEHAANLSGGSAADGTLVLSYTSDGRNSQSFNRLWFVNVDAPIVNPDDGMDAPRQDYALAYDPTARRLHFGADDLDALHFTATVHDAAGRRVGTFPANRSFWLTAFPAGLYVVSWTYGGKRNSVKLSLSQ